MDDANAYTQCIYWPKKPNEKAEENVQKQADERAAVAAPTGVDGINFDLLQTQEDVAKLLKQKGNQCHSL